MVFQVGEDKAGEWRWRLKAANGKIIATSGEGYKHKGDCLHAIELVVGLEVDTTEIQIDHGDVIVRMPMDRVRVEGREG